MAFPRSHARPSAISLQIFSPASSPSCFPLRSPSPRPHHRRTLSFGRSRGPHPAPVANWTCHHSIDGRDFPRSRDWRVICHRSNPATWKHLTGQPQPGFSNRGESTRGWNHPSYDSGGCAPKCRTHSESRTAGYYTALGMVTRRVGV